MGQGSKWSHLLPPQSLWRSCDRGFPNPEVRLSLGHTHAHFQEGPSECSPSPRPGSYRTVLACSYPPLLLWRPSLCRLSKFLPFVAPAKPPRVPRTSSSWLTRGGSSQRPSTFCPLSGGSVRAARAPSVPPAPISQPFQEDGGSRKSLL